VSRDFDFFRTDAFEPRALHAAIEATGPCDTLQEETDTRMLQPFNWAECRDFFLREAHALIL